MSDQKPLCPEEIEDFVSYISTEKAAALNTIEAYSRDLQKFAEFLRVNGKAPLKEATEVDIVEFLSEMKNRQYATSSISRTLIALKVFFHFLKREGMIPHNPALYLETPKLWLQLPSVLTVEEMERLLLQPKQATEEGIRDLAMMEVLYSTGIRVSESCRLHIEDVDDNFLRVFGKGRKERIVPIGKQAIQAVDVYLHRYRWLHDSEKQHALFVTRRGCPIDRIAVWKSIKKYARQAGIIKNISPHTFRHTCATHLLESGAEMRVIQEILGHASISSTDRYAQVSNSHLREAFHAFHPRL